MSTAKLLTLITKFAVDSLAYIKFTLACIYHNTFATRAEVGKSLQNLAAIL